MQPRRSERSNKGIPPRRFCHELLTASTPIAVRPRDYVNATMSDNASRRSLQPSAFRSVVDNEITGRPSFDGSTSLMRTSLANEDEFGGFPSDNELQGAVGYSLMPQRQHDKDACITESPPRTSSAPTDVSNAMTSSGSYTDAEPSFDRTVKPRSPTATLSLPPGTLLLQPRESLAHQTSSTMRSVTERVAHVNQRPLHELPTPPPAVSPAAPIDGRPTERDSVLEMMRQMMQRMDEARVEAERGRIEAERIRADDRRRIDADRAEDRRQIDDLNRRMQLMMGERSATVEVHAALQQEDRGIAPDDAIPYIDRHHVPSQRHADIDGYPTVRNIEAHPQRRNERVHGQPIFDDRMGAAQWRDTRSPQIAASEYGGRMRGPSVYAASNSTPPPGAHAYGTPAQLHAAFNAPSYGAHGRFGTNAYAGIQPHDLRKLTELPTFTGRAEEWPMFIESYRSTTAAYRYSDLENMTRLQKCLSGEARQSVESMLIHSRNTERVLDTLQRRFGRPNLLVRSQIQRMRELAPLDENKLEQLEPFATTV